MNRIVCGIAVVALIVTAQSSPGALILNYQFESVVGSAPNQTTPDTSDVPFVSSPTVNALLGAGSTPTIDYPGLITGTDLVSNVTVKSLNPNSAMSFPGGTSATSGVSRVSIANASAGPLAPSGGFTNITIAAWAFPTSASTDRAIASKIGGGSFSSNRGWQIYSPAAGGGDDLVIDFFQNQSGSGNPNASLIIEDVLPLNTWTHVAFTFNGTTPIVYINGVSESFVNLSATAMPTSINATNGAAFLVGTRGNSNTTTFLTPWIGGIDDVRVYNEVLGGSAPGSNSGIGSLLTPVPEPNTILMTGIGLIGVVVLARKRCFA
jgi:hypothetical protein